MGFGASAFYGNLLLAASGGNIGIYWEGCKASQSLAAPLGHVGEKV